MDSQDSPPTPDPASPPAATPAPWWQRVLPVTLAVVLLLAVAGTLLPGFRHQLALSFTRQPVSYVELYFARATSTAPQTACVRKGGSVQVRFLVGSHLEKRQAVAYRVVVDPLTKGLPTRRQAASVRVAPGTVVSVTRTFAVPRREAYVVSVKLPAFDQELRGRCPARKR